MKFLQMQYSMQLYAQVLCDLEDEMNANITRDEALKLLKAAGCSRNAIKHGSELLGLDLNKLFDETHTCYALM